jgi:hypothetical protein
MKYNYCFILLFLSFISNAQESGILKPAFSIHEPSSDSLSQKLKRWNNEHRQNLESIKLDTTKTATSEATIIKWFALEKVNDTIYWQNVYLDKLLIEFNKGVNIYTEEIKVILNEIDLSYDDISDSSMFKNIQNFYVFKVKPPHTKEHMLKLINACINNTNILYAEPAVKLETNGCIPNDPKWLSSTTWQWGNILTDVDSVWCYFNGGTKQIISVIDDALDIQHEDLRNIIWDGLDMADLDTNFSYDVIGQSHGTHVTGIIAASKNNSKGIAGVVNDSILFFKIANASGPLGSLSISAAVNSLDAISTIASIRTVNMSFRTFSSSSALQIAIQNAHNSGKLLIAAAGNDNTDNPAYPAAYTNVISVSAVSLTANGVPTRAPYSNYGSTIDISAPGGNDKLNYTGTNINLGIISTVPATNQYTNFEGTSMAAPYVTGIAALIFDANPFLTNLQVRNILTSTAMDYGAPGKDDFFGHGCVNAFNAYVAACSQMPTTIWANRTSFCQGETAVLNAQYNDNVTYQWRLNGINIPNANSSTLTVDAPGNYSVRIQTAGCFSNSISIPITVLPKPTAPVISNSGANNLCQGQTTTLSTTQTSGLSYQWIKDGTTVLNANNNSFTVSASGSYQVEVLSNGCKSISQPFVVTVNQNPSIPQISAPNTTFCKGSSVTISCNNVASTYQWKRDNIDILGATSNILVVTEPGSYKVEAISIHSCKSTSTSVNILENLSPDQPVIEASGTTEFCEGGSVFFFTQMQSVNYQWLKNNVNIIGANAASLIVDEEGKYALSVSNTFNCAAKSNEIDVVVNDLPPIPIITNLGSTLLSSASIGNQWYRNLIPIQGAIGNTYSPIQSGKYSTRVTNINGCSTSSVELDYFLTGLNEPIRSELLIYPNPAHNIFYVQSNDLYVLDIIDVFGKTIISDLKIKIGYNEIETTNFSTGIYLLKFKMNESNFIYKIIID